MAVDLRLVCTWMDMKLGWKKMHVHMKLGWTLLNVNVIIGKTWMSVDYIFYCTLLDTNMMLDWILVSVHL